ncbi:hypothetical protein [Streptomyces sp. DT171]|uniref:hypothetical protein n=1 Tax=Streptomyces sp. DT171 TaxID=3416524 RepID=UPI003CF3C619
MTQSGQGDEQQHPAVRPAHEGLVLPAEGGDPWAAGGTADRTGPAGGQPWGQQQSWPQEPGPEQGDRQQYAQQPPYAQRQPRQDQFQRPGSGHAQPLPPAQGRPHGAQPPHGAQQSYGGGSAVPPGQQPYGNQAPPQPYGGQAGPQPYAQPLPPEAGQPGGQDADATQFIAPVPGGVPPESPAEATQFLPQGSAQPGGPSDADATQYIPPVPGGAPYGIRPGTPGDRPPPAEFDSLFRSDEPSGGTQQLPRFDPVGQRPKPPQQPRQAYQQAAAPDAEPPQGRAAQRKKPRHIPLIIAVVVGCSVVGLGAGALLSGGEDTSDNKQPVASASSPASKPAEKAADPAESQAQALDKLLADSNSSRAAVIGAVEKIKGCQDLDRATTDLQGAAEQRRELVTRLGDLTIDQLPEHGALASSLTKAWEASASADDHYAAWAGQAKNNGKVCKHGKARQTSETAEANRASGEASTAKQRASGLWNTIADKYGLTRRAPTQL